VVVLAYKKGENPITDRFFSRLVEQGLYMYWYNLFLDAKKHEIIIKSIRQDTELLAQGLHSNISGVFFIYFTLIGICTIGFLLEWLFAHSKGVLFAYVSFRMIVRYCRSLYFLDFYKEKQELVLGVKNIDSDLLDLNLKHLKSIGIPQF